VRVLTSAPARVVVEVEEASIAEQAAEAEEAGRTARPAAVGAPPEWEAVVAVEEAEEPRPLALPRTIRRTRRPRGWALHKTDSSFPHHRLIVP
jgi:hypothetical protein